MYAFKSSLIISLFLFIDGFIFSQSIFNIPLKTAYEKQEIITSKDFVQSFTYVKLETSPQCIVGANPRIDLTNDEIILTDRDHCFVFDKSSGSFIREIGHIGRDPEGYKTTTQAFFNRNTKMFYFLGWKNDFIKYSIDGKCLGSVSIPNYNSSDLTFTPEQYTYLNEKYIVCNLFNTNGIQPKLLMIFDENGKEIKSIPNRNIMKEHDISIKTKDIEFCIQEHKLLYYEIYNDTVFHLTLDKTTPYIIWDRGKYKTAREKVVAGITPRNLLESEKFITFSFMAIPKKRYFALFDKSNLQLRVCEIEDGVINDINGFMPFFPVSIQNEEMIELIQPVDILKWFEKNSKSKIISSDLRKFATIDLTENPIVVFAKLYK